MRDHGLVIVLATPSEMTEMDEDLFGSKQLKMAASCKPNFGLMNDIAGTTVSLRFISKTFQKLP